MAAGGPRGFNNPSINGRLRPWSARVGFLWPFATGKRVAQANLLLEQIINCSGTRYVLIPNQHIGVEGGLRGGVDLPRVSGGRGGVNMKMDRLVPARCPLPLRLKEMKVDGQQISSKFLRPETQETLGEAGYDKGAKILTTSSARELAVYDVGGAPPRGQADPGVLFKRGGSIQDYCDIIPLGLQ